MQFRDRVVGLRRVRGGDLVPNAANWRMHPERQREALRGVLSEVGFAGAVIARQLPDGALELLDGHLRVEECPDEIVPVLVVDVDDAEAAKLLATYDPIGDLAEVDPLQLDKLLREIDTGSEGLQTLLADLADEAKLYQTTTTTTATTTTTIDTEPLPAADDQVEGDQVDEDQVDEDPPAAVWILDDDHNVECRHGEGCQVCPWIAEQWANRPGGDAARG